jgi:hypothetical protein
MALVTMTLLGCWLLTGRDVVRRLMKAGIFCVVVAVLLTLAIRVCGLAPLPLAFQMVPVTALVMVLLTVGVEKVEVVRSKPAESPGEEPSRRKPGKKRRKR